MKGSLLACRAYHHGYFRPIEILPSHAQSSVEVETSESTVDAAANPRASRIQRTVSAMVEGLSPDGYLIDGMVKFARDSCVQVPYPDGRMRLCPIKVGDSSPDGDADAPQAAWEGQDMSPEGINPDAS